MMFMFVSVFCGWFGGLICFDGLKSEFTRKDSRILKHCSIPNPHEIIPAPSSRGANQACGIDTN